MRSHIERCPLCALEITEFDGALLAGAPDILIYEKIRNAGYAVTFKLLEEHVEIIEHRCTTIQKQKAVHSFYSNVESEQLLSIEEKANDLYKILALSKAGVSCLLWEITIPMVITKIIKVLEKDDLDIKELVGTLEIVTKVVNSISLNSNNFVGVNVHEKEIPTTSRASIVMENMQNTLNALRNANSTLVKDKLQ